MPRLLLDENKSECTKCGCRVNVSSRFEWCFACRQAVAAVRPVTRPVVRHIAGYVPPKGSIAWALLGRIA